MLHAIPFKLYIKIDFTKNELVMDISSKLLGDNYYQLISIDTIKELIQNLADRNILILKDFNTWYRTSSMLSCDITRDINYDLSTLDLKDFNNIIKNPKAWEAETYDNGIEFYKQNRTRARKVNFKIYNKYCEICSPWNNDFLNTIEDPEQLKESFQGTARLELELRSFQVLRQHFNTMDLSLSNLIEYQGNPLVGLIHDVFDLDSSMEEKEFMIPLDKMTIDQARDYLVLEKFDFDLTRVYDFLCVVLSPTTKKPRVLQKYRQILNRVMEENGNNNLKNTLSLLRQFME